MRDYGPTDIDVAERIAFMKVVRDAMYDYGPVEDLAMWTGRSTSCLHAIRSGRTQWPQWKTLYPLIRHLGLRIELVRRGNR